MTSLPVYVVNQMRGTREVRAILCPNADMNLGVKEPASCTALAAFFGLVERNASNPQKRLFVACSQTWLLGQPALTIGRSVHLVV